MRSYTEYTPEERQEWLKEPLTRAFMMAIEEKAEGCRNSCTYGLAHGRSEEFARADAGGWRELEGLLNLARMDLK